MSSRTLRFGTNVGWNLLGQAGLLILGFLAVPFLMRGLGKEGYALYGLLGLMSGYLCLLNFGASNATMKFIPEHAARGEGRSLWGVIQASLILHTGGVLVGSAAVLLTLGYWVQGFFKVGVELQTAGAWVIAGAAAAAVFCSLIHGALGIFQGLHRFELANLTTLLQTGLVLLGSVLLLHLGYGLKAVAVLFVSVNAVIATAAWAAALTLLPLPWKAEYLRRPETGQARRFLGYALTVFLAQLAWSVVFQWDKAIIGYFLPLSELTYYLIPAFILQKFWILANAVSITSFPLMSELSGLGEHDALRRVYKQCSGLVLWSIVPGFAFLFALAPQFLTLWLGSDFSLHGTWPLRYLLTGYFLYLLSAMPMAAAYGLDRPRYATASISLQAALCVGLWMILVPRYGIDGAALGFLGAQFLTGLPYVLFVSRTLFGIMPSEYLDGILLRPCAAGAVFALCLWPARSLVGDWLSLAVLGGVSMLLYGAAGLVLLEKAERETLAKLLGAVREKFFRERD